MNEEYGGPEVAVMNPFQQSEVVRTLVHQWVDILFVVAGVAYAVYELTNRED